MHFKEENHGFCSDFWVFPPDGALTSFLVQNRQYGGFQPIFPWKSTFLALLTNIRLFFNFWRSRTRQRSAWVKINTDTEGCCTADAELQTKHYKLGTFSVCSTAAPPVCLPSRPRRDSKFRHCLNGKQELFSILSSFQPFHRLPGLLFCIHILLKILDNKFIWHQNGCQSLNNLFFHIKRVA